MPLLPDRGTIHSIGCTHDSGHPSFGHGGEIALNYCMREAGGFEGNGQTLRILGRLENFSAGAGANPSHGTMLGLRDTIGLLERPRIHLYAVNLETRLKDDGNDFVALPTFSPAAFDEYDATKADIDAHMARCGVKLDEDGKEDKPCAPRHQFKQLSARERRLLRQKGSK
jgi:dGTP triphosphohydrolase